MDAELRKAAGEEGTENEEGEPIPQLFRHSSLLLPPPLPLSQKRSVPPVPSWLQPTVPMRPKVPSRLLPCRRRKKCESILEPNLILNNAHGDPLIPPLLPSPPLRGYFLDGKFFIAAALGSTLTKLAIRYLHQVAEPQSKNVRINTVASFPGLPTVQFVITYSMLKWSEEAARRFYHMNF